MKEAQPQGALTEMSKHYQRRITNVLDICRTLEAEGKTGAAQRASMSRTAGSNATMEAIMVALRHGARPTPSLIEQAILQKIASIGRERVMSDLVLCGALDVLATEGYFETAWKSEMLRLVFPSHRDRVWEVATEYMLDTLDPRPDIPLGDIQILGRSLRLAFSESVPLPDWDELKTGFHTIYQQWLDAERERRAEEREHRERLAREQQARIDAERQARERLAREQQAQIEAEQRAREARRQPRISDYEGLLRAAAQTPSLLVDHRRATAARFECERCGETTKQSLLQKLFRRRLVCEECRHP